MSSLIDIVDDRASFTLVLKDGSRIDILPTPRLLDESGYRFVEAYESDPPSDRYPAIWRVRDDVYDKKWEHDNGRKPEYRVVDRIERKKEKYPFGD